MSDFVFPSDQDRADDDELNRVCTELEDVMAQAESDEQMANIYRVENINLRGERDRYKKAVEDLSRVVLTTENQRDALAAHLEKLNGAIIAVFAANNTSRVAGFDKVLDIASQPIRGVNDE